MDSTRNPIIRGLDGEILPPESDVFADAERSGGGAFLGLGVAGIAALVLGLGWWAASAQLADAVVTQGVVAVESRRQVVQHPDGGVIAEILARDGDTVQAGDVVLRLDGSLQAAELEVLDAEYFELAARIARLEAERDGQAELVLPPDITDVAARDPAVADLVAGQRRLLAARLQTVAREAAQLAEQSGYVREEIAGLESELVAVSTSDAISGEELVVQERLLRKGLTTKSRVAALRRARAENNGRFSALRARIAAARGRQARLDSEAARLAAERIAEAIGALRDVRSAYQKVAKRRAAAQGVLSRLDVRAPATGTVIGSVATTPRSVVRPGQSVMEIVPTSGRVVVEARVAIQDVDRISRGQSALLRFTSLQSESTPEIEGQVLDVSADALRDQADRSSQPFFSVKIGFAAADLEGRTRGSVVPGMPVEMFILAQERSVLSYLVKPLSDYFSRAFRES